MPKNKKAINWETTWNQLDSGTKNSISYCLQSLQLRLNNEEDGKVGVWSSLSWTADIDHAMPLWVCDADGSMAPLMCCLGSTDQKKVGHQRRHKT
jgi:hypothetical protein